MYRKLIMTEIHQTRKSTVSELRTEKGQFLCFVIEDGFFKIGQWGNTRIPSGTYMVAQRKTGETYERYQQRFGFKFVPHLLCIPAFSQILISIGNSVKVGKSNLLVNTGIIRNNDGDWQGVNSAAAYQKVYSWLKFHYRDADTIYLQVIRRSYV